MIVIGYQIPWDKSLQRHSDFLLSSIWTSCLKENIDDGNFFPLGTLNGFDRRWPRLLCRRLIFFCDTLPNNSVLNIKEAWWHYDFPLDKTASWSESNCSDLLSCRLLQQLHWVLGHFHLWYVFFRGSGDLDLGRVLVWRNIWHLQSRCTSFLFKQQLGFLLHLFFSLIKLSNCYFH